MGALAREGSWLERPRSARATLRENVGYGQLQSAGVCRPCEECPLRRVKHFVYVDARSFAKLSPQDQTCAFTLARLAPHEARALLALGRPLIVATYESPREAHLLSRELRWVTRLPVQAVTSPSFGEWLAWAVLGLTGGVLGVVGVKWETPELVALAALAWLPVAALGLSLRRKRTDALLCRAVDVVVPIRPVRAASTIASAAAHLDRGEARDALTLLAAGLVSISPSERGGADWAELALAAANVGPSPHGVSSIALARHVLWFARFREHRLQAANLIVQWGAERPESLLRLVERVVGDEFVVPSLVVVGETFVARGGTHVHLPMRCPWCGTASMRELRMPMWAPTRGDAGSWIGLIFPVWFFWVLGLFGGVSVRLTTHPCARHQWRWRLARMAQSLCALGAVLGVVGAQSTSAWAWVGVSAVCVLGVAAATHFRGAFVCHGTGDGRLVVFGVHEAVLAELHSATSWNKVVEPPPHSFESRSL